jgi:hypothetical protein
MKFSSTLITGSLVAATIAFVACKKDSATATTEDTSGTVPAVFSSNYKSAVTLSASATTVTLKSNGTPDHKTPYWGTGHAMYEAPVTGQTTTPGQLATQNFSMTIPINPVEASSKEATSLGPIGMALNGVAIYNDREGGNVQVDAGTLTTFDKGGGHSGPGGLYHYHFNGDYTSKDDAKLIGYLRDGFPIYGRKDTTGVYPTNLDVNGGHTGPTQDYPNGIYHYHCSNVAYMNSVYYILKAGSYHGTKGTFTF